MHGTEQRAAEPRGNVPRVIVQAKPTFACGRVAWLRNDSCMIKSATRCILSTASYRRFALSLLWYWLTASILMQSRAVAGKPRDVAVNGVYMIVKGSMLLRTECGK